MKVTSFLADDSSLIGAWAKLAQALAFPGGLPGGETRAPRSGLLARLDRWLWKQEMREREAYLARAQNVFELEERMRRLDRGQRFPYY
jgi:hypothetical protein